MKQKMTRRHFVKTAAGTLAISGLSGCTSFVRRGPGRRRYNFLIRGGTVYDGLGNPGLQADVAVSEGRIARIGRNLDGGGAELIDAAGLAVSPGFIDAHSHTAIELLADARAESQVRQGVTSEICGNCGGTPFPVAEAEFEESRRLLKEVYGIDLDWRDINGFFTRLRAAGHAINHGTLLGHGSLRGAVVGFQDRPGSTDEIRNMQELVEKNLQAGALGLSAGLEYAPGSFAGADELIALCRPVAKAGGVFSLHMRNEGDNLLESLDEATRIARASGVSLQISHFKTAFPRNWGKLDAAFARLEQAQREGVQVTADRYPYIAGATGLNYYFPMWAKEGTNADFIARLKDPALDERLRRHLAEVEERLGSWERVRISDVFTQKNKALEGKNILDAARSFGKQHYEFMRDLLVEEQNRVGMVTFTMNEENLRRILAHPLVMVGSDGSAVANTGILARGKPHPRFYGAFARILAKYVRDDRVLTLPQAIRKMTSMPARKFGLDRRGRIKEGYYADIVVFDPDRVKDEASFDEPARYPSGIHHVLVNGVAVIRDREHTGKKPGVILKRT